MDEISTDLKRLIETELSYTLCFSTKNETANYISFTDTKLPDMYDHNFFYFEKGTDLKTAADLAAREYERVREAGKGHVKMLFEPGWEPKLEAHPFAPFTRETYLFMGTDTDSFSLLKPREDSDVRTLSSEKEGKEVFQLESNLFREHPDDFGRRRAERKLEVYSDATKPLDLYLCYHNGRLIGDCEFFIPANGLIKIEDFDIHPDFQRNGFGTTVLHHLLKQSNENDISFAYLVADKQQTAQHMYSKCHFSVLYEQTCLFYLFEKGVN